MRKKLSFILLIVGLVSFAFFLTLVISDVIDFGFLWVKYVLSASALLFAVALNMAINRRTVFDDALLTLKRIKGDIETLGKWSNNPVGHIKVLSLLNKLNNASTQIEEIIAEYDCYDLKAGATALREMSAKYSAYSQNEIEKNQNKAEDTAIIENLVCGLKSVKDTNK